MKKYAMILMGSDYDPNEDRAVFKRGKTETHILTVRDEKEAVETAKKLKSEGFGAIEVCGAFGKDISRKMYEATDKKVPVSYVITDEDQIKQVSSFWGE